MQLQLWVRIMGILTNMVDPPRIEERRPALNPMNFIALLQQKFRQMGAILSGYSSDKGAFRHSFCLLDKLENFHEYNSALSRCSIERHSELLIE